MFAILQILLIREKDFYLIKQSTTSFLENNNENKRMVSFYKSLFFETL